jgi:hypothetical protein
MKNTTFSFDNLKRKERLEDLDPDERIILK